MSASGGSSATSSSFDHAHTVDLVQEGRVYGADGIVEQFAQAVTSRVSAPWSIRDGNETEFHLEGQPTAVFGASPPHKVMVRKPWPRTDGQPFARLMTMHTKPELANALLAEFVETLGASVAEELGARIEMTPASVVMPEEYRVEPFTLAGIGQFVPNYAGFFRHGRAAHFPPAEFDPKLVAGGYLSPPMEVPALNGLSLRLSCDGQPSAEEAPLITQAIKNFLAMPVAAMDEPTSLVYRYYKDMTEDLSDEECLEYGIPLIEDPATIWDYVTFSHSPHMTVNLDTTDPYRHPNAVYFDAGCLVPWENEHGLQVVFLNGERVCKISQYDGWPTNASALAKESLLDVVYVSHG